MPRRVAAADAPVHAVECPSFLKDYVRSLIVAGRTIVENGVVRSVDLAALESELLGQARAAWPPRAGGVQATAPLSERARRILPLRLPSEARPGRRLTGMGIGPRPAS